MSGREDGLLNASNGWALEMVVWMDDRWVLAEWVGGWEWMLFQLKETWLGDASD